MPLRSLAQTLFPLAKASATQPRSRLQSPFSPLVSWLAKLLASERRKAAKKGPCLIPEPPLFTSPASLHESSNTPPTAPSTDITGIVLHDDNDDASEMHVPLSQPYKDGLTKEDVDYVVNSLLEYLEQAKVASPESGGDEYEYYAPKDDRRRLRHGLWSPASSLYVLYGDEDRDDLSEAETLEMDEAYDRASLELARTECHVPELRDDEEAYPYHYQFECGCEGGGIDSE